ncbi:MAG: hypothetical protein EB051_01380 [Chlamydiia bacterium]|nr:hypothetical protein [Chlamydiia bacterium]
MSISNNNTSKAFGPIRSFLWPIHGIELKKFIPMLVIFFFVGFNYSVLRITKDALVVTAPGSGAEALPFLKVWAILPMAFLFTFIFTRVANKLSREKVFYVMMSIFIAFFLLFSLILYPCKETLHPHQMADIIQSHLPLGLKGLIAIFRNWTYSAFYVMAEMWSTIIMTVLVWGFANDVTSVKDAKRYYGVLGIAINISGIAAGHTVTVLSQNAFNPLFAFFGSDAWGQAIFFLNMIVILTSLISVACFRYLHKTGHGYNSETYHQHHGEDKVKMGLRKNFAYLAKSKYLVCLSIIVVTYNIAINLVEVVWKDQMRQLCDATKEIAFIPLSKESKLKGKAAIDGVGSRLGKSGGSVIHQGLLMFSGTVALSTPYVAALLFGVIGAWMVAVKALGKQFNALASNSEAVSVPDETSDEKGSQLNPLESPAT